MSLKTTRSVLGLVFLQFPFINTFFEQFETPCPDLENAVIALFEGRGNQLEGNISYNARTHLKNDGQVIEGDIDDENIRPEQRLKILDMQEKIALETYLIQNSSPRPLFPWSGPFLEESFF